MSATTSSSEREKGVTLTEKLKVEWPVLLVLGGIFLYLTNILGDMRLSLARLEARQNATESIVPVMQTQISQHSERMTQLGERVTRIEATIPPK